MRIRIDGRNPLAQASPGRRSITGFLPNGSSTFRSVGFLDGFIPSLLALQLRTRPDQIGPRPRPPSAAPSPLASCAQTGLDTWPPRDVTSCIQLSRLLYSVGWCGSDYMSLIPCGLKKPWWMFFFGGGDVVAVSEREERKKRKNEKKVIELDLRDGHVLIFRVLVGQYIRSRRITPC